MATTVVYPQHYNVLANPGVGGRGDLADQLGSVLYPAGGLSLTPDGLPGYLVTVVSPPAAPAAVVYPLRSPVQARIPAPARGGTVTRRAGAFSQTGAPVKPAAAPVRARIPAPARGGIIQRHAGVFGQSGPAVRPPAGPVRARIPVAARGGRAATRAGTFTASVTFPVLTNTFEGGTNGVTVTAGNSGGTSGAAFDVVTSAGATLAFDNAHIAHGTLAAQIATVASASSFMQWSVSAGPESPAWFRAYLYFTANPGGNHRLVTFLQSGALCGFVQVLTTGKLQFVNAVSVGIFTTTQTIPVGQWFRIEGFLIGSATVGQVELKLFDRMDAVNPAEVDTSAATQNTNGVPDTFRYGVAAAVANAGPFWIDDIGLSSVGYLGPASSPQRFLPAPVRAARAQPVPRTAAGRVLSLHARPQGTGPAVQALRRAVRARLAGPQLYGRVRTSLLPVTPAVPPALQNAASHVTVTGQPNAFTVTETAGVLAGIGAQPHGSAVTEQAATAATVTAVAASAPSVSDG